MFRTLLVVVALALAGCASAPPPGPAPVQPTPTPTPTPKPTPAPAPADVNSIQPEKSGFSPGADAPANVLTFDVKYANASKLTAWTIAFDDANGPVKTLTGTANLLPPTVTWDGKNEAGQLAPEGRYTAKLTVSYGKTQESAVSVPFVLDITPPGGSLSITPDPFVPTGSSDHIYIKVYTRNGGAQVMTWRLQVVAEDGTVFKNFISEEHRDGNIDWNGQADSHGQLKAPATYKLVLSLVDEFGNRGTVTSFLKVDQLGFMDGNRRKLAEPLYFQPYTDSYTELPNAQAKHNRATLAQVVTDLKKYPEVKLLLEGHANEVWWRYPEKAAKEQRLVLLPLSQERAKAVKKALVAQGIDPARLETVGLGGSNPVVPFSDTSQTWKNRRVEFYIR